MSEPTEASGVKILYSSDMLRVAIRRVLSEPKPADRRVALVAYVGGQAETFLPDPDGLELVCALQAGVTDAVTLSRLQNRGARLFKSDRLHMKVYWSSRKGCIICSANASGNALGGGNQKEAGVWLPAGMVNINRLWQYAAPTEITAADLMRLSNTTPRRKGHDQSSDARAPDFMEWTKLAGRKKWKVGWYSIGQIAIAEVAKEKSRTYGIEQPHDSLIVAPNQAKEGDWLLAFVLNPMSRFTWMYTDFVVAVPEEDSEAYQSDYPFQAIQLQPLKRYPSPPFVIDQRFQKAFKAAVKTFGKDNIVKLDSLVPPAKLLTLIKENWDGNV